MSAVACGVLVTALCTRSDEAHATGAIYDILSYFSFHYKPKEDSKGNVIYDDEVVRDADGDPVRNPDGTIVTIKVAKQTLKMDPVAVDILRLGVDLTFDPSQVIVVTDLSTSSAPLSIPYGFLCNFSTGGSCIMDESDTTPDVFGSPLPGSSYSFNVDNVAGHLTLSYDFSSTPVTVTTHTDFFGFTFEPVVVGFPDPADMVDGVYMPPVNLGWFTQHPESSDQYCVTTQTALTGLQCSSVPEPSQWLLILSGFLSVALLKYKNYRPRRSGNSRDFNAVKLNHRDISRLRQRSSRSLVIVIASRV
jgi:hypothetical protein